MAYWHKIFLSCCLYFHISNIFNRLTLKAAISYCLEKIIKLYNKGTRRLELFSCHTARDRNQTKLPAWSFPNLNNIQECTVARPAEGEKYLSRHSKTNYQILLPHHTSKPYSSKFIFFMLTTIYIKVVTSEFLRSNCQCFSKHCHVWMWKLHVINHQIMCQRNKEW